MKKIIFFAYTLEVGGAEKVLCDYINILKDKYKIDLCVIQNIGEFKKDIPSKVNIIELRHNTLSYIPFRYLSLWRKYVINKIVNKGKYDIAIGFLEGRSATWVADIKRSIKKIAFVHNDVNKFDIGISEKEILDTYKKLDKIITVSEVSKNSFCEKYHFDKNEIQVLYNLIDEKSILEKAKEKVEEDTEENIEKNVEESTEKGIDINDIFTFVNVGKMRPQKRQDRLVEIARDLKKEGYKFKIQIIGNGPEEENIKNLVKEYNVEDAVELKGLKLNPYPYIKNADVVVVSSDFEGYSIAIKEALLLGKPIISTDVSGVREMFEDGKYGIITKVETEDLKNKMKDVLDGKIDIKNIEKNLENYDCGNKKIIEQLEEIINE